MKVKKINITYIIDTIGWAGAQTHLISVLNNIDYTKFNVSVVCLRSEGTQFELLSKLSINSLVLNLENLMSPMKTLKAMNRLMNFLKINNTDIFQSYMFNPNLIASIITWLPGRKYKLITTRRDTGYWHKKRHWWLYKFMNIVTDKVISVSSQVREESIKMEGISPNKIITIFNGIDLNVFNDQTVNRNVARTNFGIKEGDFVVGILAALRPEKRHDLFIKAALKVAEKIDNVKFMIVGDGYQATKSQISNFIMELDLEDKFILTGKLSDVVPALSAFDISILCSDTEGMSNTVLQSIAMGKATIVTNVGGNPEVVDDNVNGLLVPANDSNALAESIVELYGNDSKKRKLEKQAVITASEKFNIYPIVVSLQDVYMEMMLKK